VVLSFDVEEHFRIEAAANTHVAAGLKRCYGSRMESATGWLLDELAKREIKATFFVLGQIARDYRQLILAIHAAGHEVASHGWDHQCVQRLTPASFRRDVAWSKDAIEQITGQPVLGYRAPTFSIVRETSWAIDELVELGFHYDSSIYPVWHDRYGVPDAPRAPFLCQGVCHRILELPLATLRSCGANLPVAGGGYFRLLPLSLMEAAICRAACRHQDRKEAAVAVLYFHPWEFDARQPRLPLRPLSRLRTYVGIHRSRARFKLLLDRHCFARGADVAGQLLPQLAELTRFCLADTRVPAAMPEPAWGMLPST
jgi:polysaccharide deacetylase family protein (PEP-CTERM system associated)